jgi:hypothetical protein
MSMVRRPWLVSLQPHNVLRMRFTHVPSSDLGHFDIVEDKSFMLSQVKFCYSHLDESSNPSINKHAYFLFILGADM